MMWMTQVNKLENSRHVTTVLSYITITFIENWHEWEMESSTDFPNTS